MRKTIKIISIVLAICLLWQQISFAAPVDYSKLRALALAERPVEKRPPQFRLRTLLLATTIVAVFLGGIVNFVPMQSIDSRARLATKYERLLSGSEFLHFGTGVEYFRSRLQALLYEAVANKPEFTRYGRNANINVLSFTRGEMPKTECIYGSLSASDVHDRISPEFVRGDFIAASAADGDWKFYDSEFFRPRTDIKRIVLAERRSKTIGTNIEIGIGPDGKTTRKETPMQEHHLEFQEYFVDEDTGPVEGVQSMAMNFQGPDGEQKVLVKIDTKNNTVAIRGGTLTSRGYTDFWGLEEGEYGIFNPAVSELVAAIRAEAELQKASPVYPVGFRYLPVYMQEQYKPESAPSYLDNITDYLDRVLGRAKGKAETRPQPKLDALPAFRTHDIFGVETQSGI